MLLGTSVAHGMIYGLLNTQRILMDSPGVFTDVCAGMIGATIWNIFTWVYKIPSSSSHALIGGLMGAFVSRYGTSAIYVNGLIFRVLLPLLTSPVIGYIFGYLIYRMNHALTARRGVRVKRVLTVFQIFTCIGINAFQGSNDAQKGIGVIVLLLMANRHDTNFYVPKVIILVFAAAIVSGLAFGGFKMIKNVGTKIYDVRAIHSMSAQTASLIVIAGASASGFPVSGTQIVNSAILGVGAADRPSAVGWTYAKNMLMTWLITIPASFILSAGFSLIFSVCR